MRAKRRRSEKAFIICLGFLITSAALSLHLFSPVNYRCDVMDVQKTSINLTVVVFFFYHFFLF